jgi:hypothetical protein
VKQTKQECPPGEIPLPRRPDRLHGLRLTDRLSVAVQGAERSGRGANRDILITPIRRELEGVAVLHDPPAARQPLLYDQSITIERES